MGITLIWAMAHHRVIGNENKLPWYLPADLKHFRNYTLDKTILMGRHTYESIGKPLPQRKNVVLTRDEQFVATGCHVVHTIVEALSMSEKEELVIIGGANVYKQFLPLANRLELTYINAPIEGETFFPYVDFRKWTVTNVIEGEVNDKNPYPHRFVTYKRET